MAMGLRSQRSVQLSRNCSPELGDRRLPACAVGEGAMTQFAGKNLSSESIVCLATYRAGKGSLEGRTTVLWRGRCCAC